MAETATAFLSEYLSPELVVFVVSMLPILELRGGLVAASYFGMPWLPATIISVIGNVLPIPIILLFVRKVLGWMRDSKLFHKIGVFFEEKAMKKGAEVMAKYPHRIQFALFLFVAIPLPGTGAWTGALIAAFLGLEIKRSLPPICLGVVGASIIMLVIAYVIPTLIGIKG